MKITVYYNKYGRIVSIVEAKSRKDAPNARIFPMPDCFQVEVELTDAQAKLPLLALHAGYGVNVSGKRPQLVPLVKIPDRESKGSKA